MRIKVFLLMILPIIALTFVVIALIAVFSYFADNKTVPSEAEFIVICFNNKCLNVEKVSSFPALMKGLMFRKNLEENSGMLFIFSSESKHDFWMKNTLIPLDIIWISENKEIVYITKNVQPCKDFYCPAISPDKVSRYVLEINSGKADEIGLKIGDKMEFELR